MRKLIRDLIAKEYPCMHHAGNVCNCDQRQEKFVKEMIEKMEEHLWTCWFGVADKREIIEEIIGEREKDEGVPEQGLRSG